jgi:hypothetical protein
MLVVMILKMMMMLEDAVMVFIQGKGEDKNGEDKMEKKVTFF